MIPLFLDKNLSHVYTFSQRYYVFSPLRRPFAGVFVFWGAFLPNSFIGNTCRPILVACQRWGASS
jgi:hypothetical protein